MIREIISYEKRICLPGTWDVVRISSADGEKSIGRPIGRYDTLSVRRLDALDDDELIDVQEELARRLCEFMEELGASPERLLIVGLGNKSLCADAIGPKAASKVRPTMHIKEYDAEYFYELECSELAVLTPGVSAHTGMDSAMLIRAVTDAIRPDAVIAIDSLMTSSRNRLGSTFQISDTGLFPGGLGNMKTPITRRGVGVPVIGIGVPTVMDSRLFINERRISDIDLQPLFISPREIDEITDNAAAAIGGAINQAFGLLA